MKRLILWLPLGIFLLFVALVAFGLNRPGESTIRSQMIGKAVPEFTLPAALAGRPGLASRDLATGAPRIVNIFASWCVPCIAEAPQLMALKRQGIPVDAIAIRDRPEDIAAFLAKYDDPYERIGLDADSRVQLALGSSGVPETFVIDGKGIIRHQVIGGIGPQQLRELVAAYEAAR
ncbi:MAG TPA: DsbE family thiol:disulfide interchange protein [Allosphingosinicella sp.]